MVYLNSFDQGNTKQLFLVWQDTMTIISGGKSNASVKGKANHATSEKTVDATWEPWSKDNFKKPKSY